MLFTKPLAAAVLAMLLAESVVHAQASHVTAEGAWSRATPPGTTTGAIYVTLTSLGDDTLLGVSSPASVGASVHTMTMDGDVMRMREVSDLALPAGQHVILKPSGYHIMLTDLKSPLKQGQTVRVRLTFAKSAPVEISAVIAGPGASNPPGAAQHDGMAGMKMP